MYYLAAILIILIGIAHSHFGEHYLLMLFPAFRSSAGHTLVLSIFQLNLSRPVTNRMGSTTLVRELKIRWPTLCFRA